MPLAAADRAQAQPCVAGGVLATGDVSNAPLLPPDGADVGDWLFVAGAELGGLPAGDGPQLVQNAPWLLALVLLPLTGASVGPRLPPAIPPSAPAPPGIELITVEAAW